MKRTLQGVPGDVTGLAGCPEGKIELRRQRNLIARLKLERPPPQWQIPHPHGQYPVNAPCFCGSGKKYKKCHGRQA
jgi:hypothetical protein